jgi:hypothetical protein
MNPILVFAGPSLPARFGPDGPFEWRGPARAGDLVRLLDRPPERLCLIDGFFDSCPAPWHKEILMLMARGTRLFGASSMGALRAAELHRFGMVGVGAIFRAYRDGRITGDDEVALIHATEALDWAPLSVPMVEVRATLAAACRAGLVKPPLARRIRAQVHDVHFSERDWPLMESTCVAAGYVDAAAFKAIRALHVPLKRHDAIACLAAAREDRGEPSLPSPPETCFIRRLIEEVGSDEMAREEQMA